MGGSAIKIGILHSLTGVMAFSEKPLIDGAMLAVEEINAKGGILGHTILPVVSDGESNPDLFAAETERLISRENIKTFFGCWTSASRKAVKPIVEKYNALLWYPVQYEGFEESRNIIYTGSCPNQQMDPAVHWALREFGKRVGIVGSHYVFPIIANRYINSIVRYSGGSVCFDLYKDLNEYDFTDLVEFIRREKPDVVFNTVNGEGNIHLFQALRDAGITADSTPLVSFSCGEGEFAQIGPAGAGHFACWGYFHSLPDPGNQEFIQRFRKRYGADRLTSDPVATAYTQLFLWKDAVERAGGFDLVGRNGTPISAAHDSILGRIEVQSNHHINRRSLIARARDDLSFEIVYASEGMIPPQPWSGLENTDNSVTFFARDMLTYYSDLVDHSVNLARTQRELKNAKDAVETKNLELEELNLTLEKRVAEEVEKYRAQQMQLIQQQKMAEMGEMMGFIAHQWQQPISIISLYAQNIGETLEFEGCDRTELKKIEEEILEQTRFMTRTLNDFRNFFKPSAEKRRVDVLSAIRSVLQLIGKKISRIGIAVLLEESNHFDVIGNQNELMHVILNIMNNSCDIFLQKNTVEPEIRISFERNGMKGSVVIHDNGGGIPESLLPDRIFQPFVTTKGEGGSGIGLQICKTIVEDKMGGRMYASNRMGGAEFTIELPILEGDGDADSPGSHSA